MSTWHEVVLHGSETEARAFVSGFLSSRPGAGPILFGHDLDHETRSLGQRLRELLQGGHTVVLFVPDDLVHPLGEAVAQAAPGVDLRIERSRVVGGASFHLQAEVFSREIAGQLRAIVRNLPPGVHDQPRVGARGGARRRRRASSSMPRSTSTSTGSRRTWPGSCRGCSTYALAPQAFDQVDLGPLVLS